MSRRNTPFGSVLILFASSATWGPGTASAGPSPEITVAAVVDLARKSLELVERSARRPALAAELDALEDRIAEAARARDGDRTSLLAEARSLRRRIIFSHPALDFDRLLINRRSSRIFGHMCDQYYGRHSKPGPGLTVIESWKDEPQASPLLGDKLPPGMTMHPDLSYDGKRVTFAYCSHEDVADRRELAFFVHEAALDGSWVRQVTGTENDPRVGALGRRTTVIEDFDPCYLPGGGFVFTSTRSQQYGRCHGSRYVPSYVLYRSDADGSNVERISFNEANEWDPAVLHDGRIVYCRWDYINRHDTNFQSLWVTRPDGSQTAHFYGNYSVGPCMITEAQPIPGSHKVVATVTDHHGYTSGSIVIVDPREGEDGGAPLSCVTPEIGFPERGAPEGTKFLARPLASELRNSRGRAATPWPLSEELFLVAYPYREQFAIYLVDTLGGRELIYCEPDVSCFAPMPIRSRPEPTPIPDVPRSGDERKDESEIGRFYVQDVYRSTQPLERGSIQRLRVNEIISQPTRAKPRLSYVDNEVIKRVLGTVPVAPDGSVAFEVPADTPLQLQLLDENGMAVMTMRSLLYARPGETTGCVGCHEPRQSPPPGAALLESRKFVRLEPPAGPRYDGGFSFARSVQPVLDRHCIGCHGLGRKPAGKATPDGGVSLLGTPSGGFSEAYHALMRRGGVVIAQRNRETATSRPKEYYAHAGRLAKMLLDGHADEGGHPRVRLDRESLQCVIDWLDLNAQFYGDYSFNRDEDRRVSGEGEKALRQAIAERFGPELADAPFAALVNVALPGESRILKAPLPVAAGGWGQVHDGAWSGVDDPAYRRMRRLVTESISPSAHQDRAGTCGSDGRGCRCGNCWIRQKPGLVNAGEVRG